MSVNQLVREVVSKNPSDAIEIIVQSIACEVQRYHERNATAFPFSTTSDSFDEVLKFIKDRAFEVLKLNKGGIPNG